MTRNVLTFADLAIFLDSILSPIDAIADFEGPIKVIPALLKDSGKLEFSDKNPYPGCKASHFFLYMLLLSNRL